MGAERRTRRLVFPIALATTLGAALLSGFATADADASGTLPQPAYTASFRALSAAPSVVAVADLSDLPSSAVRRDAQLAAQRDTYQAQVRQAVVRQSVRTPASRSVAQKSVVQKSVAKKPVARKSDPRPASGSSRSGGSALQRAIARIPGYSAHRPAHWVSTSRYGHYGATDLASNNIYISPSVPSSKLDSVVRHEWSHILSVRAYGGSYSAMMSATNRVFGGSGMTGAERAADCMAIQLGASWTHYTSCSNSQWRAAATKLLSGRRL
jgi:hypothetical protein